MFRECPFATTQAEGPGPSSQPESTPKKSASPELITHPSAANTAPDEPLV